MNFDEQSIADFEKRGVEDIRLRLQSRVIGDRQIQLALDWVREQDAAAAALAKWTRSQTMKLETAEKRKTAIINMTIAGLALSTLIVGILSWLFPRH